MTINVLPLFPSLLFIDDVPDYQQLLPVKDHPGVQASNMGGWHSDIKSIPEQLYPYIPFAKFTGHCWYNINTIHQGNYSHQHPDNDWSGVLYLKVPDSQAKIEFENPQLFEQYPALRSIHQFHPQLTQHYNYYKAYPFTPVEGKIIIFPSSLRHRVLLSTTDEERISLSFNIKVDYE